MPDVLETLVDKPNQLKPFLDELSGVVKEIRRDRRFTPEHKDVLIGEAGKIYDDKLKTFVGNFETVCQQKRTVLESMANPPPENNGHAEVMPDSLVLSSEKAIWRSLSESKALLVEVVKNQRLSLFKDDVELMSGAEIVQAYKSEDSDPLFKESLELYGPRRLRRISAGSPADVEASLMLQRLIAERKEAAKTPNQRQAEADVERLDALHSKFHLLLGLLEKNKKLVK